MVMRVALTMVAKEAIKAASERFAGVAGFTETPFSEATADVAEVTEHFAKDRDVCRDWHLLISAHIFIVTNRSVSGVQAGHQDAAGWCTNGATAVVTGESHALIGERINVWCSEPALSKAGKVAVAKVIREKEDDVRAAVVACGLACGTGEHGNRCSRWNYR